MSTNLHPRAQLSAYLDDALSAAERTAVGAHLDTCVDCRARLSELRATASLIRSLPDLTPSRRLTPRIGVPLWIAPLRTLTTLASGVAVFLFIASALLTNMVPVATSTAGAAPQAAAPAPAAGGAAASSSERSALGAAAPSATPAPGAPADSVTKALASPTATPSSAAQFNVTTANPQDAFARSDNADRAETHAVAPAPQLGPSPWLWLALAVGLGAIAFALQRRLRSA